MGETVKHLNIRNPATKNKEKIDFFFPQISKEEKLKGKRWQLEFHYILKISYLKKNISFWEANYRVQNRGKSASLFLMPHANL